MRRQGSGTIFGRPAPPYRRWMSAMFGTIAVFLLLPGTVMAQTGASEEAPSELRERLTEREDENRLENPFSIDVLGRPLFLGGQVELSFDLLGRSGFGEGNDTSGRLLLEPAVEVEAFYSFGDRLSLFAQFRFATEHDLRDDTPERLSNRFVERGEFWLDAMNIFGSGLNLQAGRLDFEDDRTWWWDSDLDALRISHESDHVELALSVARELAPTRSDHRFIEAEHDRVRRLLFEGSWDWSPNHTLQVLALRHSDHSPTEAPGTQVPRQREDACDARLTWLGLRAAGAWTSSARGAFGYWFDVAQVRGDEWVIAYEPDSPDISVATETTRQRVHGWAIDVGATWISPLANEPRLSLGFARGSGDHDADDGVDRSFRQTGLQSNEVGFGGVQRFGRYGALLDPELSNLSVLTAGVGISLFQSSSLDLNYQRYRLVEPADVLRSERIDATLTGVDRDIGHAFDLVLAVEEWQRFELEFSASAFRPGRAFASDQGNWMLGAFLALRVAF